MLLFLALAVARGLRALRGRGASALLLARDRPPPGLARTNDLGLQVRITPPPGKCGEHATKRDLLRFSAWESHTPVLTLGVFATAKSCSDRSPNRWDLPGLAKALHMEPGGLRKALRVMGDAARPFENTLASILRQPSLALVMP